MSMFYEIKGFVTYDNPEFEAESVVKRLEQENIAADIFPGTFGGSRIEFSFFNDVHYGFEEEILRILTENELELLSGYILWTRQKNVDTSEESTVKYELLHGEIRKKTEEKTATELFVDHGSMWNELRTQMEELREKKSSIDLCVLLAVMDDIEYREEIGEL